MADLFEGQPPVDVNTLRTTATQAPQYLTDYLTNLAQVGQSQLGTAVPAVKDAEGKITTPASITPFSGEELIASRPEYYANLVGGIDPTTGKPYATNQLAGIGDLSRYKTALDAATSAGKLAAAPIGVSYDAAGNPVFSDTLKAFYDPFKKNVIDAMREASDVNLQRSILPGLKSIGIGSGQFGSSRAGTLGGQALADYGAAANRQEAELLSKGYQSALDAALAQQRNLSGAATALGGIGAAEATAGQNALKALTGLGEQDLAYKQAKIDAPLTRASNVAALLRNYQFPTTVTEAYKGPMAGITYGPSTLDQIGSLTSLLTGLKTGSGTGKAGTLGADIANLLKGFSNTNLTEDQARSIDEFVNNLEFTQD